MDEPGDYHSQQTDIRTENEIPHILTHRRVMKNENTWTQDTGRGVLNTGVYWGEKGRVSGGRDMGRDSLGRNAKCG